MAKKKETKPKTGRFASLASRRAARRQRERDNPLEVRLTLAFRFGDEQDDQITMMNDRSIPMVGSVFRYRDRIARQFTMLFVRAGASLPKVRAELLPAARWLAIRSWVRDADDSDGSGKN